MNALAASLALVGLFVCGIGFGAIILASQWLRHQNHRQRNEPAPARRKRPPIPPHRRPHLAPTPYEELPYPYYETPRVQATWQPRHALPSTRHEVDYDTIIANEIANPRQVGGRAPLALPPAPPALPPGEAHR